MPNTPTPSKLVIPRLIVGLGNPGTKYRNTRHNIGFDVVDALAQTWRIPLSENRKFQAQYGETPNPQDGKIHLLKPLTFMNRSGQSVRAVVDWFKLSPESVLVIYDDMDLPVGRIRLRLSGSAGGHNGVKSIISHLGTQSFPRLRVGIGASDKLSRGDRNGAVVAHVLGRFSPDTNQQISAVLATTVEAIELSLKQGVEKAMSLFNGRNIDAHESGSRHSL
ncbi:MAG: aminoacyl-tRNA hydrolase [Leptolyngbyaceae cyanobacterium MO_188.B28]|nr:aminoacyl-tRNA hydrolase [Leptolyngbyaceae cyanobacterium MO_188.B28]